jgi:hypothetical protein
VAEVYNLTLSYIYIILNDNEAGRHAAEKPYNMMFLTVGPVSSAEIQEQLSALFKDNYLS